jgi:hypothetical protein
LLGGAAAGGGAQNASPDMGNLLQGLLGGAAAQPSPPAEAYLRVIGEPIIRLVSVDLAAQAEITTLGEIFDFAKDNLGLLKAALISSGIVPPGLEGSQQSLRDLLTRLVGPDKGLELVSHVRGIPKGSRLAVSTSLLAAMITTCMRATGQVRALTGGLQEHERRLVAARAILGAWVALSAGDRFLPPTVWINQFSDRAGGWNTFNQYPRMAGDLNSDGRAEIAGCSSSGVYVSRQHTFFDLAYDADGALARSTISDTQGITTTVYVGEHQEWTNGVATNYYHFGGRRVAQRTSAGVSYLHADQLQSTMDITGSDASGPQYYYPYGSLRGGERVETPYQYTGQRWEARLGLYYYNGQVVRSLDAAFCPAGYGLLCRLAAARAAAQRACPVGWLGARRLGGGYRGVV